MVSRTRISFPTPWRLAAGFAGFVALATITAHAQPVVGIEVSPPPQLGRLDLCSTATDWAPIKAPVCLSVGSNQKCDDASLPPAEPTPVPVESCFRVNFNGAPLVQGAVIPPQSARLLKLPVLLSDSTRGQARATLVDAWPPLQGAIPPWLTTLNRFGRGKDILVVPAAVESRLALQRIEDAGRLRNAATDQVQLKISSLDMRVPANINGCPTWEAWDIAGVVVAAARGTLVPGTQVTVTQQWDVFVQPPGALPCPGPVREPPPQLANGAEVTAFLNCKAQGQCDLAAGRWSFVSPDAFDAERSRRMAAAAQAVRAQR